MLSPLWEEYGQTGYQFLTKNTWVDLISYCGAANIGVILSEDYITHLGTSLVLWIGMSSSLGSSLNYEIQGEGTCTINIDGYEVVGFYDHSLAINHNIVSPSALQQLLQNQGAGSYTALFDQSYVYHISIGGPDILDETTKLKFLFDQVSPAVIGQVSQPYGDQGSTMIGTDPYVESYTFLDHNVWHDVTTFCNATDIYTLLFQDWVTHSAVDFDIWIGFNSSLGEYLYYQELLAGGYSISIQGYQVLALQENEVYIPCQKIDKPQLDNLLTSDGAAAFTRLV